MESENLTTSVCFVDKITTEQKINLVTLTKALPSLFASVSLSGSDLILWGVDLSSLASEGASPTRKQSVVLLKFLRARSFDVEKSSEMLINCLKWRREFKVSSLDTEEHPAYLSKCGVVAGRDKHGNPVTYNFYGGMDMHEVFGGAEGSEKFIRWRIWLMESAIKELDFEAGREHVMQVHDYDGASMRRDAVVKASTQKIIKLFQDYYPEFLPAKLFVNVPKVMEVMFGLFSAFSDPTTRAKFNMVGHGRTRYTLLQHMDAAQLPSRYGGFLELGVAPSETSKFTVKSGERVEVRKVVDESGSAGNTEAGEEPSTPNSLARGTSTSVVGLPRNIQWGLCSDWSDMTVKLSFAPKDPSKFAAAAAVSVARLPEGEVELAAPYQATFRTPAAAGVLRVLEPGELTLSVESPAGIFFSSESHVTCLLRNAP